MSGGRRSLQKDRIRKCRMLSKEERSQSTVEMVLDEEKKKEERRKKSKVDVT